MALRVASLDYLGTVAARLRKDAVTSKMDQRSIDRILQQVERTTSHLTFYVDKNKLNVISRNCVLQLRFSVAKSLAPQSFCCVWIGLNCTFCDLSLCLVM